MTSTTEQHLAGESGETMNQAPSASALPMYWEGAQDGAHYSIMRLSDSDTGMAALRQLFPDGKANEMNVCLFSTSGVHGHYGSIEDAEDERDQGLLPTVTFLLLQPRLVCVRYGNVGPESPEDFKFLRALRQSSWDALNQIGR